MSRKKWIVNGFEKEAAKELATECGINTLVALIMGSRGYVDPFEIDEFFGENAELSDPFLIPGMDAAVERLNKAIDQNEKIAVCGDYDADGVTSTALVYSYLKSRGCSVVCSIPDRIRDGYGLHKTAIDDLSEQGVTLIITVDNGIGSVEEVEYAKTKNIDVVITDHHLPADRIPDAAAVVDPHIYMPDGEFADYAGVGVAFKLICALEDGDYEEAMFRYGDLVAVGTVADIVPLNGENRILVKNGLDIIGFKKRLGLQRLIYDTGLQDRTLTSDNISFGIGPRLNAAGRMGDSMRAFELLVTDDEETAERLSVEICADNVVRQTIEASITQTAVEMYYEDKDVQYADVCVIAGENWHHGVLGIVAARLCEKFGKPCVVLSIDGNIAKGSARSIPGFDLFESLKYCEDVLEKLGGHKLAAGLTLKKENIPAFREMINRYAAQFEKMPVPVLELDCRLNPIGINDNTAKSIMCLAPFGAKNPTPVFGLFSAEVKSVQPVSNGKSIRLTVEKDKTRVTLMCFSTPIERFPYIPGDVIDIAFVFRNGYFRGQETFSVVVKDIHFSETDDDLILNANAMHTRFKRGDELTSEMKNALLPDRDDVAAVYRYLRKIKNFSFDNEVLYNRIDRQVDYNKIAPCLDVLEELTLIQRSRTNDGVVVNVCENPQKTDLSKSEVLKRLS